VCRRETGINREVGTVLGRGKGRRLILESGDLIERERRWWPKKSGLSLGSIYFQHQINPLWFEEEPGGGRPLKAVKGGPGVGVGARAGGGRPFAVGRGCAEFGFCRRSREGGVCIYGRGSTSKRHVLKKIERHVLKKKRKQTLSRSNISAGVKSRNGVNHPLT